MRTKAGIVAMAVVGLFGATARADAPAVPRNPLYTVAAGQFQAKQGDLRVGPAGDAGPVLDNARAGDWVRTNVSVIVDGKKPWVIKRLGTLPDAPVSRENVWYQGPNFGTAFLYEPANDTLYFYGGFHDYSIGMMRVSGFLHGQATGTPKP